MAPYKPATPEIHHSTLVDVICYELQRYGLQSLIEITRTLIDQHPDAETDPALVRMVDVLQRASDTLGRHGDTITIRMNEEG